MDNEWATIFYHLKVKDWKKPVEWTFDVVHGQDTVYSMISNDSWLDSNFHDFGYVPKTPDTTYLGQKEYWYLNDIIECDTHIVSSTTEIRTRFLKEQEYCSTYWTTRNDTARVIRKELWGDFWKYSRGKNVVSYIFFSHPCDCPGLRAYYPRLKKFVMIAHD